MAVLSTMAAPISDLYERYKIGTKRVVQWLAETAGKSGNDDSSKVITVSTKEIAELADSILHAATPDSVAPKDIESIIRILEDVIAGRSECAVWYKHKTAEHERDKEFERSQKGHRHFIDVLCAVLACLKRVSHISLEKLGKKCKSNKAENPDHKSVHVADEASIRNTYQDLEVEEPSVSFLAAAAADLELRQATVSQDASPEVIKASKKPRKKKKKVPQAPVFELEPQDQDGDFALWCFLKECHRSRLYVRSLWQEYAAGRLSFHIASIVTDKAFMIIRNSTAKFMHEFPALRTMGRVAEHLDIDAKMKGTHMASFRCKGSENASLEVQAVDLLCIPALLYLTVIRQTFTGSDGVADEENMDQLEHRIMYQSEAHPLTWMCLQLTVDMHDKLKNFDSFLNLVGTDAFTTDLIEALPLVELPIHTVIEFQTYMDIVEITDPILSSSLKAVLCKKEFLQSRIRNYEKCLLEIFPTHNLEAEEYTEDKHRTCARVIMTKGLEGHADVVRDQKTNDISWAVKFPVFGGSVIGVLTTSMYIDGILACDRFGTITCMAHVYRACRTSGLLKKPWKDMDFLIATINPDRLKLPPPAWSSSALQTSAQHYRIVMGMPAEENGQVTNVSPQKHGRAKLPPMKQIEKQRTRLYPDSRLANERLYAYKNMTSSKPPTEVPGLKATLQVMTEMITLPKSSVGEEMHDRAASGKEITPIDLLRTWRAEIEHEELMKHHFDLHGLMIFCLQMLHSIGQKPDLTIRHKLPANHSFIQLTDEILWEAADVGLLRIRKGNPVALCFMAQLIDVHITVKKRGSALYDGARELRDVALRHDPKSTLDKERMAAQIGMTNFSASSSISMAGRQVAFQTGKPRLGDKFNLEAAIKRAEARGAKMEELRVADMKNGLSYLESMNKLEAEEQKEIQEAIERSREEG